METVIGKRCKFTSKYWQPPNQETHENGHFVCVEDYGIIVAISTMYEELTDGVGQYPAFVILKDDGKFETTFTDLCVLLEGVDSHNGTN